MKKGTDTKDIDSICKQYGAKFVFDQFSCTIVFKDGKMLKYAMNNQGKNVKNILKDATQTISSSAHGRIFNKDNKFVGFAPKGRGIDETLVIVDMMVIQK